MLQSVQRQTAEEPCRQETCKGIYSRISKHIVLEYAKTREVIGLEYGIDDKNSLSNLLLNLTQLQKKSRKVYISQATCFLMEQKQSATDVKELILRLAKIQSDLNYVKERVSDFQLDEDDLESIEEAKQDLREGKTRRL